jgi:hypothetical protein
MIGKNTAITSAHIPNTRPNIRRLPTALLDAKRTKNAITSQTVAGRKLKKRHIARISYHNGHPIRIGHPTDGEGTGAET